ALHLRRRPGARRGRGTRSPRNGSDTDRRSPARLTHRRARIAHKEPLMTETLTTRPPAETVTQPRTVERLVAGIATSDGAGVKMMRVLTQPLQRRLDPFLMLDAFGSDDPGDYIGGFPDHPHRGFE